MSKRIGRMKASVKGLRLLADAVVMLSRSGDDAHMTFECFSDGDLVDPIIQIRCAKASVNIDLDV